MPPKVVPGFVVTPEMIPIDEKIRRGRTGRRQGAWIVHDLIDHDVCIDGVTVGASESGSVRIEPAIIEEPP